MVVGGGGEHGKGGGWLSTHEQAISSLSISFMEQDSDMLAHWIRPVVPPHRRHTQASHHQIQLDQGL